MGGSGRRWRRVRGDPGLVLAFLAGVAFWVGTAVFEDDFREPCGLETSEGLIGDSGMLPSFFRRGEPLRVDKDDGARPPDAVRPPASGTPDVGGSGPGTGEGALEPLAAVALRI